MAVNSQYLSIYKMTFAKWYLYFQLVTVVTTTIQNVLFSLAFTFQSLYKLFCALLPWITNQISLLCAAFRDIKTNAHQATTGLLIYDMTI